MKKPNFQSELLCPKCGEGRFVVIETERNIDGSVRRRRECNHKSCGYRESSIEIVLDEFKRLQKARDNFTKFQKLAGECFSATDIGFLEKKDTRVTDLKCYTCAHATMKKHKRICSFAIPEAFSADSEDCNLFEYKFKDGIGKLDVGLLMK